jgi:hypothetical protein
MHVKCSRLQATVDTRSAQHQERAFEVWRYKAWVVVSQESELIETLGISIRIKKYFRATREALFTALADSDQLKC